MDCVKFDAICRFIALHGPLADNPFEAPARAGGLGQDNGNHGGPEIGPMVVNAGSGRGLTTSTGVAARSAKRLARAARRPQIEGARRGTFDHMDVTIIPPGKGLGPDELAALARAVDSLENVSLAARITGLVGRQIDLATHLVPERARAVAARATNLALRAALHVAMRGVGARRGGAMNLRHKALAMATGAAGGAFGLSALPLELPASTIVMLRSIADIAREHGEDLASPEATLACLEVFALGGGDETGEDHLKSGYFAARALLARSVSEAARYIVERGVADEAAPVIVRLISMIASRFGVVVTQKVAVPLLGALGGAAVNYAFIDHFQSIARGHFTVRQLERLHGADVVREEYLRLLAKNVTPRRDSA